MANLTVISGGETLEQTLERAREKMGECDSVVILMQKKKGGILWFAPDSMRLESLIFLLWTALVHFGKI